MALLYLFGTIHKTLEISFLLRFLGGGFRGADTDREGLELL